MPLLVALLIAQFDPASIDPVITVNLSSDARCAGIGPAQPFPAPVRLAKSFPGTSYSCGGSGYSWMAGDGQGDVAYQCISYLPEGGWAQVISADGTVESRVFTYAKPLGLDDGFAAAYNPAPYGPRQQTVTFSWFDGTQWQVNQYVDPQASARFVAGHAWNGVLLYRNDDGAGSGPTTQWVDAHGFPLTDPLQWGGSSISVLGVDFLNNALVNASGTLQWIDPSNTPLGGPFAADPHATGVNDPLLGGGFVDRGAGTFYPDAAPWQPSDPWLNHKTGDMQMVNNGAAYAFTREGTSCAPTVSLYALDGTFCGTVNLYGPHDTCPQPASLGVDSTLIQDVASDAYDRFGARIRVWRWWPQMFP